MPKGEHGLSPRVRGSLSLLERQLVSAGSIPAGAGEPNAYAKPFQQDKVYPRGCGGAYRVNAVDGIYDGLSPRVRGSHWTSPQAVRDLRSIPRGCGGAAFNVLPSERGGGLSPRVRGSRQHLQAAHAAPRSIPAGAGEPCPCL